MTTFLDTPVLTPAGWSTIADTEPGDAVFGSNGTSCQVTTVTPVFTDTEM